MTPPPKNPDALAAFEVLVKAINQLFPHNNYATNEIATIRAALSQKPSGGDDVAERETNKGAVQELRDIAGLYRSKHPAMLVDMTNSSMAYIFELLATKAEAALTPAPIDVEELKRMALHEFMKGRSSVELKMIAFDIISETFNILNKKGHLQTPVPGWLPIESAPKDGTEILLYSLAGPLSDMGLCYWRDDLTMTGWTWGLGKAFNNPTHWMPLPTPPATERTGDE